jgi:death-on-curing protein
MLVHLDRNNRTIHDAGQRDLYALMLDIAQHIVGLRGDERSRERRRDSDEEVAAIASWLKRHTRAIVRSERTITFRRLKQCLARFNYELRTLTGNRAEVGKTVERRTGLFKKRIERVWERAGVIGYRDDGTEVSNKDLRAVRRMCNLTEEDGVDSDSFYEDAAVVDGFVNRYRTVLRRLAKT